jgi:hypothetical protein
MASRLLKHATASTLAAMLTLWACIDPVDRLAPAATAKARDIIGGNFDATDRRLPHDLHRQ